MKSRTAGLEVHIGPSERQELAATRAGRDREQDQGVKRRPFRVGARMQQRGTLLIRENRACRALCAGKPLIFLEIWWAV